MLLRLFTLLLITTTTLLIYGQDPCKNNKFPTLTYTLRDEFGDDATAVLPGGRIKITCNSAKAEIGTRKGVFRGFRGSQFDLQAGTTTITLPLDSSKINVMFERIVCKCNDTYKQSDEILLKFIVCSQDQYTISHEECAGKEICMVNDQGKGNCHNLTDDNCVRTRAKQSKETEYRKVCLGNTYNSFDGECKAGVNASATAGWPTVETSNGNCTKDELRNFWEGNFSLRHNIPIKDSRTFRPRDQKTTVVCQNGIMTCHRKCPGGQMPKKVTGNCSTGWTVTTKMTENCNKTKFYCIYQQNPPTTPKFRWQFYLYSANVDVAFNGTKAQCEWPGWTGLHRTNPEAKNRTCQQEFKFPYPVNPEGRKVEVGDDRTFTDIPTTTTETTTAAATTETTKQSTAKAVTASTTYIMSLISKISETPAVPLPQETKRSTTVHPDIEKWEKKKRIGRVLLIIGSIGLAISLLILFLVICDVRQCTRRRKLLEMWIEELKEKMKIEEETLAGEKERWDQYERDLETMQFWENKKHWDAMQKEKHEKWMAHQEKKEKVEERRKKEGKPPLKKKEDKEEDKKDDKKDKKKDKKKEKKKDKRKSEQKEEISEELSETPSSGQYIPTIEQPMKPEEYLVKKPLSPYQPDDYRVVGLPDYAKEPKVTEEEMSKLLDRLSSGKQLRGRDMEAEMYRSRVKWGKNEIFTFIERRKQKRLAIIENWKKEWKMWCWKIWAASAFTLVTFILLVAGFTMHTVSDKFIEKETEWAADRDSIE